MGVNCRWFPAPDLNLSPRAGDLWMARGRRSARSRSCGSATTFAKRSKKAWSFPDRWGVPRSAPPIAGSITAAMAPTPGIARNDPTTQVHGLPSGFQLG